MNDEVKKKIIKLPERELVIHKKGKPSPFEPKPDIGTVICPCVRSKPCAIHPKKPDEDRLVDYDKSKVSPLLQGIIDSALKDQRDLTASILKDQEQARWRG